MNIFAWSIKPSKIQFFLPPCPQPAPTPSHPRKVAKNMIKIFLWCYTFKLEIKIIENSI